MKKLILMIFMLILSSNALAEWSQFANNADKSMFVYVKLPKVVGPLYRVKMWVLSDFNASQRFSSFEYKSITAQWEFDCKEEKSRLLYAAYFNKNMSKGNTVAIDQNTSKWSPASPGSINEGLWKFACGMD